MKQHTESRFVRTVEEMSFGSYTYQKANEQGNRKSAKGGDLIHSEPIFRYREHLFQIRYLDEDGAALIFLDPEDLKKNIEIPERFTLFSGVRQIHADPFHNDRFTIWWINDYQLKYSGTEIWKLTREKQQAITAAGNGKKAKHKVEKMKTSDTSKGKKRKTAEDLEVYLFRPVKKSTMGEQIEHF